MSTSFLEAHQHQLNKDQYEAVSTIHGPVLVLAGAGSGKTRVLTYRIAHLVYDYRVPLSGVLAMTFSNKSAREMHDRVKILLGDESTARLPWISTFHSVSARILRRYGESIGFKPDFVIYDEKDQLALIKDVFSELNFSEKDLAPEAALKKIGEWKERGLLPDQVHSFTASWMDEKVTQIYQRYSYALKSAQAMDFDDLLLHFYWLLKNREDIKLQLQNQWPFILVDEFQDTNLIQYQLLKELIGPSKNICVVGDDDQSIYGWRGAKIENILEFDKEFSPCKVVKLEQNYRSTENILKAASAIISKNEMRHSKELWTDAGPGEKISLKVLPDDRDEARFVAESMRDAIRRGTKPSEIAVLYRVNSLSRGFEEECLRARVPYRIVGGFRFYERKEVKDILSYLRLILNPADIMSFRRTINTPARGLGKVSVEKLEAAAQSAQLTIGDWICSDLGEVGISKSRAQYLEYRSILNWGRKALDEPYSLADLFVEIVERTQYLKMLESEDDPERVENIRELFSAVQDFEESLVTQGQDLSLKDRLRTFLEHVSLMADIDGMENEVEKVTFMSLHAAKGLEFDICFLAGMEDGLFPSSRSFDSYERTEEERRLCYVGMTRAKKKLYLTRAERRRVFGSINFCVASRFLKDIPPVVLDKILEDESVVGEARWASRSVAQASRSQGGSWSDFEFNQEPVLGDEKSTFSKGDRVRHPSFGEGIVQKSELLGDDECLSIVFHGRGLKKVLAKFVTK